MSADLVDAIDGALEIIVSVVTISFLIQSLFLMVKHGRKF